MGTSPAKVHMTEKTVTNKVPFFNFFQARESTDTSHLYLIDDISLFYSLE